MTQFSYKMPWEKRYIYRINEQVLWKSSYRTNHRNVYVFVLQVGKVLQLLSTFFGGFIIAFVKGWLLTLVMLSSIPLLVISGATMAVIISKMATRGQTAYAQAATIVEQTIGSIRTVCST